MAIDRAATFSQPAYSALMRFAASRRIGASPASISSLRLGIAFTERWERSLVASFVRAAIASAILRDAPANSDTSDVLAWARQHINEKELEPLGTGVIVVEFAQDATVPWTVSYEFEVSGEWFEWVLDGMASRGTLRRVADVGRLDVPSYPVARKLDLDDERVPRQPFTLGSLLPPPGEARAITLDTGPQWAGLTRS